jgi:hypothetical protein
MRRLAMKTYASRAPASRIHLPDIPPLRPESGLQEFM